MEKYIKQLLKDIQNARRQLTEEETEKAETFEQHIEEVERYLEGTESSHQHLFSYHCGLKKEQFPPADRLNYEQMNTICNAFEKLLASWNIHATLPEELPAAMAYDVLVGMLDEKITIVTSGFIGWEFCYYVPEECVFKEYCTCKVQFAEMDEADRKTEILVQQLLKILEDTLQNRAVSGGFSSMHRLLLEDPKPIGELQTIAKWLDIPIDDFPMAYQLNENQTEAICEALLAYWDEDDDMHIWLAAVNSSTRYRALVDFLKTTVWCTNKGMIILPPIKPEELKNFKSPLDNLNLRDTLDFSADDFEDDLPF